MSKEAAAKLRDHLHIDSISSEEIDHFDYITYTMGGMMVFPGTKIDGKMTINGARGCNSKIRDRFDLTVECIRRYYRCEESPLYNDLARYSQFFQLFGDFKGYVDFFLLQDLVSADYTAVRFFTPSIDFDKSPLPEGLEDYRIFRERTIEFVNRRNARIGGFYG